MAPQANVFSQLNSNGFPILSHRRVAEAQRNSQANGLGHKFVISLRLYASAVKTALGYSVPFAGS